MPWGLPRKTIYRVAPLLLLDTAKVSWYLKPYGCKIMDSTRVATGCQSIMSVNYDREASFIVEHAKL